ncbi:MAG TPA: HEAT repeat domain-containing protein [Pirellulaceae bacterium]|nr:HEAT repeat domain-containing protein [Pirellulaceae bacterium]
MKQTTPNPVRSRTAPLVIATLVAATTLTLATFDWNSLAPRGTANAADPPKDAAQKAPVTKDAASKDAAQKAEPTKDSPDKDYSAELPKIPPKSPDDSLKAIRLKAGFHAELVAAEPLVRSPMAMDFDEYGRAFVVQLPEYNQYASAKPHGKGSIMRLEDTDGDGRYDRSTTYVDDLNYPTAVACWDGGILVGVAPDILYCKDTDGDGKADVRRRLFTGFGQDKAGEGMINSFRWRIDNRFHIPTGLDGGEIVPVVEGAAAGATNAAGATSAAGSAGSTSGPGSAAAPKPLNARGQHLLLEPRAMTLAATSGGGQHGMSLDDWSLRGFVCGNSEPCHLVMYDGRYVARNPYLQAPAAAINIAPDGKFTKLMRVSGVEPWRVLRTRLRKTGVIPGSDEGGTPSGFFTGATGITVYRGDAWPAEYRGQLFVGEVANNLVYRARLEPNGVGLTAHRADADAEFLASADNWFRPVQFANAPDGTLYVIDMYRELIEGAAFLAPAILKHMDTAAGANQGRIYRIAPDGFRFTAPPKLGDFMTVDLVKLLEHPNGWHRDTASRLIYQRQDRAAIAPLRQLAESSSSPLARIMALYSLDGLQALEPKLVLAAFSSPDASARQHAARLAESLVESRAGSAEQAELRDAVIRLTNDTEATVRYQAAFSLGEFPGEAATRSLVKLALRSDADSWLQLAVLSSVGTRRGEFLSLLLADPEARKRPAVQSLAGTVAQQIGQSGAKDDLALLVRTLDLLAAASADKTDKALAEQLVKSVSSKQPAVQQMLASVDRGAAKEILAGLVREARAVAADATKPEAERAAAVRTLATAGFADAKSLLQTLLEAKQPRVVQVAALETLGQFDDPSVPTLVVAAWSGQTPQVRATSTEVLLARPQWVGAFLDAIEQQKIARADLDPARVALLQQHGDASIRQRAVKLLGGATLARRQEVVDSYQKALELKGDVDRGRTHFRKVCAACHKLEGQGESIGADLNAIRDRGVAAVLLNILDPNREVKPQFHTYVVTLEDGRTVTGMITAETANSLTIRKADNTSETILRLNIEQLRSTGLSFMPEGLEKQLDHAAMADLLAYLNSIK